jgi:hypothetical protein
MAELSLIRASGLISLEELWTDQTGRYALLRFEGSPADDLLPYDVIEHRGVGFDDRETYLAAVARMTTARVPVAQANFLDYRPRQPRAACGRGRQRGERAASPAVCVSRGNM